MGQTMSTELGKPWLRTLLQTQARRQTFPARSGQTLTLPALSAQPNQAQPAQAAQRQRDQPAEHNHNSFVPKWANRMSPNLANTVVGLHSNSASPKRTNPGGGADTPPQSDLPPHVIQQAQVAQPSPCGPASLLPRTKKPDPPADLQTPKNNFANLRALRFKKWLSFLSLHIS